MLVIRRLVLCVAALVWTKSTPAQEPQCRPYKTQSTSLDINKEPRGDAVHIETLDNADVVCMTREQQARGHNWGFVDHEVLKSDQRKPDAGWADTALLQRLLVAEAAPKRGLTTSPPAAAAAPAPAPAPAAGAQAEEIVRFDQPLTTGPFPVNGQSLEQLIAGTPLFPPIEGLPENLWKKPCGACHQWDRRTLCEQGAMYVKNPNMALRGSHPYGGAEKVAMMNWAKTGCQ